MLIICSPAGVFEEPHVMSGALMGESELLRSRIFLAFPSWATLLLSFITDEEKKEEEEEEEEEEEDRKTGHG